MNFENVVEESVAIDASEDFCSKLDEDLDNFFALYLQSEDAQQKASVSKSGISEGEKNHMHSLSTEVNESMDYEYAIYLQSKLLEEDYSVLGTSNLKWNVHDLEADDKKQKRTAIFPSCIVDDEWEILDPTPNIHNLFIQFNKEFFWGYLDGVVVKWSNRMTLCAGVCCYEGRGGLCTVSLSQPLLKFRPRRDLIETLLHEMIHAFLFVTENNKDHEAHGPEFLKHMRRINEEAGTNISVYHNFHDEVDIYRKHWWKCNGPCQNRRPFFGIVKRAMNREPSFRDPWWHRHLATCGGTFIKIKEPEKNSTRKNYKRKADFITGTKGKPVAQDIRSFFTKTPAMDIMNKSEFKKLPCESNVHVLTSEKKVVSNDVPFPGKGFVLGSLANTTKNGPLDHNTRSIIRNKNANDYSLPRKNKMKISSSSIQVPGSTKGKLHDSPPLDKGPLCRKFDIADAKENVSSSSTTSHGSVTKGRCVKKSVEDFFQKSVKIIPNFNCQEVEDQDKGINCTFPSKVSCPSCGSMVDSSAINAHLDLCLLLI